MHRQKDWRNCKILSRQPICTNAPPSTGGSGEVLLVTQNGDYGIFPSSVSVYNSPKPRSGRYMLFGAVFASMLLAGAMANAVI